MKLPPTTFQRPIPPFSGLPEWQKLVVKCHTVLDLLWSPFEKLSSLQQCMNVANDSISTTRESGVGLCNNLVVYRLRA